MTRATWQVTDIDGQPLSPVRDLVDDGQVDRSDETANDGFYSDAATLRFPCLCHDAGLCRRSRTGFANDDAASLFYHINRTYLTRVTAIVQVVKLFDGRLKVVLTPPAKEQIFVSRQKSTEFRQWLDS